MVHDHPNDPPPEGCIELITIGVLRIARISVTGGQVVKVLEPADLDSDYALGYLPVVVHPSDAEATAEMVERIVTAGFSVNLPPADVVKYPHLVAQLRTALRTRQAQIGRTIHWMEQSPQTPVNPLTREAMNRCGALYEALTRSTSEITP